MKTKIETLLEDIEIAFNKDKNHWIGEHKISATITEQLVDTSSLENPDNLPHFDIHGILQVNENKIWDETIHLCVVGNKKRFIKKCKQEIYDRMYHHFLIWITIQDKHTEPGSYKR